MNKRGISSVITLALIVLGTVIGAAFLWAFVVKNTERGGEIIDPDCLTVDLDIIECKAYGLCSYGTGLGGYDANILVKRGVGQGNLTGLRFIFENSFGIKAGVYDKELNQLSLNELENLQFRDPYNSIPVADIPNLVSVVALIGKDKKVCPIASAAKICEIKTQPPAFGAIPNTTYTSGQYYPNNRGGNCCQWLANPRECYNGEDTNYPINNLGIVTNPTNAPLINGLPPGNRSVCCNWDPYNGPLIGGDPG